MYLTTIINNIVIDFCNNNSTINERDLISYVKEYLIENNYNFSDKIEIKIKRIFKIYIKKNQNSLNILSKSPLIIEINKNINISNKNLQKNLILISHERDLHIHLEKFLNLKKIKSFTIYHEKSIKDVNLQWLHPDMVGYSNYSDHSIDVLNLSNKLNLNTIDLYSFELKLEINFSNLRKCYFQAVSNSSWANYGYLVVENINLFDIDLMNECYRLTEEFRIGLIKIDINNYFNSKIIIESKKRNIVDRNLINIMVTKNPNFKNFITEVAKN